MGNMVINPIAFFSDLQGQPLQKGNVYIGAASTNPVTNPVTVYEDAALTTPMQQPLKTLNGCVSLNGTPQPIYVAGASYSILVTDKHGNVCLSLPVFTNPLQNEVGAGGASQIGFNGTTLDQVIALQLNRVIDSIATLRTLSSKLYTRAFATGYYAMHDGGGGAYQFDPNDITSADNGVTIIVASDGGRWKLQWFGSLSVEQAGAVANGTSGSPTDSTTAFNAIIAVLQTNGGGKLVVPARSQGFAINGTLALTAGGVTIEGANRQGSLLVFNNGAQDCITFEGASFAAQIYGFELRNLQFKFGTKTAGRTFYAANSNQIVLENLEINGCWTGIELYQNNTVKIADVVMQGVTSATGYGIYWHAAADGSGRSDWLILDNWAVNCMYSGANGLVIDGLVATLIATRCNILQCTVNILVYNSAESANNFPNYLQFTDVQTEGAKLNTVQINGGVNIKFVDCAIIQASGQTGQGSSDGYAVAIYPDLGFSYTRNVSFMGCSIGQGKGSAVFSNARNTRYIGCDFQAGTTMTANTQPALHIGPNSDNTLILASTNNIYGTPNNWQYGLLVDAGSTGTIELGNDWRGSQTKEVQWNSTDSQSYAGADLTSTSLPISSATQTNPQGFTGSAGATLTPAQVLGGIAYIGGTPGTFTNTTPTAAQLVAAMASPSLNKTLDWMVINATNGALTIQPGAGVSMAGVTSSGNFVITSGTTRTFKVVFTDTAAGAEAVSIYG